MNSVQLGDGTVTENIRYGLARRGHNDASGLVAVLRVSEAEASRLYSGSTSYTHGQLERLAAYFELVSAADLLDENLIVDERREPAAVEDFTGYEISVGPAVASRVIDRDVQGNTQTNRLGFITRRDDDRTIDATFYNGDGADHARQVVLDAARDIQAGRLQPEWITATITTQTPDGKETAKLPAFEVLETFEGVLCEEPSCDLFEQIHTVLDPTDPPVHEIGLRYLVLNQWEDRPWELLPVIPEEAVSGRQVAQIIADLTTGQRMLADLNAARSKR